MPIQGTGIDFNGNLGIIVKGEVLVQRLPKGLDLVEGEVVGRAAAPVHLLNPTLAVDAGSHLLDVADQILQVRLGHLLALGNYGVAAAEVTSAVAKGNVAVKGKGRLFVIADRDRSLKVNAIELRLQFRGRGIASVARQRPIVLFQQFGIKFNRG